MFRPSIYKVKDVKPVNSKQRLNDDHRPDTVVSMIGLHRNLARKGDRIQVSGTLEQVEHLKTGKESYQIVVGSGTCENEYIKPFVCVTAQ